MRPPSKKAALYWIVGAVVVLVGGGIAGYKAVRWKRFAEVVPGVYRSGQLAHWQLNRAIDRCHLKTVLCLNREHAESERELCAERGVGFHYFPMPSDGLGQKGQFTQVLTLLADPNNRPILVHCHAGVARTGASIALYRTIFERWPIEQAIQELAGFERNGVIDPALRRHLETLSADLQTEMGSVRSASQPNADENPR